MSVGYKNVCRYKNVVQLRSCKNKRFLMTACQIKRVLEIWNNGCQIFNHKKSPNIRPEGLFRIQSE